MNFQVLFDPIPSFFNQSLLIHVGKGDQAFKCQGFPTILYTACGYFRGLWNLSLKNNIELKQTVDLFPEREFKENYESFAFRLVWNHLHAAPFQITKDILHASE